MTHVDYVIAAYVATILALGGLLLWLLLDQRRQKQALADLERRGIRRRSDTQGAGER